VACYTMLVETIGHGFQERPSTAPELSVQHKDWQEVNILVSDLFGDVLKSVKADLVQGNMPRRPHTACVGLQAVRVPADEVDDVQTESDGGSLDPDDDSGDLVNGCASACPSTGRRPDVEKAERNRQTEEADVSFAPTTGEYLLLRGLRPTARSSQTVHGNKSLPPTVSEESRPPLKQLPASMGSRMPRTCVLAPGGGGMAPQASRLKSHNSWKEFLPGRRLGGGLQTPKTARPSGGYPTTGSLGSREPEVQEAACDGQRSGKQEMLKGPKYRVAPGASRPARPRDLSQVKQDLVLLEFRSEPRVIPARRIGKDFLYGSKRVDFAPRQRFRQPEAGGWAQEREALVKV